MLFRSLNLVRRVERDAGAPIAALLDTKGPEIRTWNLVKINGNWHHVDIYHDLNLAQNFNLTDKHQFFLQSDDFVKKVSIEYKIGKRTRKHNIYKIWNKNRIPAAPTSQNSAKTLPDLTN